MPWTKFQLLQIPHPRKKSATEDGTKYVGPAPKYVGSPLCWWPCRCYNHGSHFVWLQSVRRPLSKLQRSIRQLHSSVTSSVTLSRSSRKLRRSGYVALFHRPTDGRSTNYVDVFSSSYSCAFVYHYCCCCWSVNKLTGCFQRTFATPFH